MGVRINKKSGIKQGTVLPLNRLQADYIDMGIGEINVIWDNSDSANRVWAITLDNSGNLITGWGDCKLRKINPTTGVTIWTSTTTLPTYAKKNCFG